MTTSATSGAWTQDALLAGVGRLAALGARASDASAVRDALAAELLSASGGEEVRVYELAQQRTVVHLLGGRGRIAEEAPRRSWPPIVDEVVRLQQALEPAAHRGEAPGTPGAMPIGGPSRRAPDAPYGPAWGPDGWVLALPLGADAVEAVLVLITPAPPRRAPASIPALPPRRRELATVLMHQAEAALAVVRARAAAATDPLTGALNRRSMVARLAEEIARAQRAGGRLGCLVIDLDHFKQVNDRQGHRAGDVVLRHVAAALRSEFRAFDGVARMGGDEFVVILPGAGPERAARAAHRALSRLTRERPGQAQLSASVGAACWRAPMAPLDLVHAADSVMLIAKRDGGGRVASADEPFAVV